MVNKEARAMKGWKKEKERVRARAEAWAARLGLAPWWEITHRFAAVSDDDSTNQATTSAMWFYRAATITWFLEKTVLLSDTELDTLVVHELCHLMLDPVAPKDGSSNELEYATECVARAILTVYTAPVHSA